MFDNIENNKELMNYLKRELDFLNLEIKIKREMQTKLYIILSFLEKIEEKQGD